MLIVLISNAFRNNGKVKPRAKNTCHLTTASYQYSTSTCFILKIFHLCVCYAFHFHFVRYSIRFECKILNFAARHHHVLNLTWLYSLLRCCITWMSMLSSYMNFQSLLFSFYIFYVCRHIQRFYFVFLIEFLFHVQSDFFPFCCCCLFVYSEHVIFHIAIAFWLPAAKHT